MKIRWSTLSAAIVLGISMNLVAQKPPTVSPRDSVKALFDGKKIVITYGKPSMRGRKIFGDFVRYYRVWRTGDGAATQLTTEMDLEVDGAIIPRGTYTLYSLPTEERWKLIINKQTGQWGTAYTQQLDLARIDLQLKKLKKPVEALTFKLEKETNNKGILRIEWEKTSLAVPFHISSEPLMPSPRDSISLIIADKRISIDYGRPSMRGRKIMGNVVPYQKVWRTGANAATRFVTQSELMIGTVKIPRGSYTLYTLPTAKQWTLIINKQTGQWGTVYNEKQDLVRIPLKKSTLKQPMEKFTISLEPAGKYSGVLKLSWENTQLSTELQVR
jgi:hypothetical protein